MACDPLNAGIGGSAVLISTVLGCATSGTRLRLLLLADETDGAADDGTPACTHIVKSGLFSTLTGFDCILTGV